MKCLNMILALASIGYSHQFLFTTESLNKPTSANYFSECILKEKFIQNFNKFSRRELDTTKRYLRCNGWNMKQQDWISQAREMSDLIGGYNLHFIFNVENENTGVRTSTGKVFFTKLNALFKEIESNPNPLIIVEIHGQGNVAFNSIKMSLKKKLREHLSIQAYNSPIVFSSNDFALVEHYYSQNN